MLSSRRYSVKRHVMNLHGGDGLEVRYVDYMEGRLTGIYNPNYSKQQQSSAKCSTFSDAFYGATRTPYASSSLFFSSNPFNMPYTTSQVYHRSVRSNNSYSDPLYKGMKPSPSSSSATPGQSQDLLSQMTNEFSLEYARELARKAVSATTTTTPQQNMQSSIIQGGLGNNSILGVQNKQEDIFG
jgi:hypothetical protein